jgi:hypothetical protein
LYCEIAPHNVTRAWDSSRASDLAADVVEVDVHALRTAARQRFADVLIFVVDSGVEARFLREPLAFLGATRDSNDAGSFYLRDHAHDRAGCACSA